MWIIVGVIGLIVSGMLIGAANRDHRQFGPDGDAFDINREPRAHLGFSVGAHFCLGSSLARLEGRVALEEILKRFPEWEIDMAGAEFCPTSTIRGSAAIRCCSSTCSGSTRIRRSTS